MNIICSICLNNLTAEEHTPCVASCGHTFHQECLLHWFLSNHTCPLCKKTCNERSLKPIFFSTNDETNDDLAPEVSRLENDKQTLIAQNESLKARTDTLEDILESKMEEQVMTKHQLKKATKSLRYLKQLRRVSELDDAISSPTSQSYLQTLSSLSREDLLTNIAAICQRSRKTSDELAAALRSLKSEQLSNQQLTKKIRRLKKSQNPKEDDAAASSSTENAKEVIILDTESEGEDEEEKGKKKEAATEKRASRSPSLTAEASTPALNKQKGRAPVLDDFSDEEAGPSSSRKRKHSLPYLTDDEFQVEEHDVLEEEAHRAQKRRFY